MQSAARFNGRLVGGLAAKAAGRLVDRDLPPARIRPGEGRQAPLPRPPANPEVRPRPVKDWAPNDTRPEDVSRTSAPRRDQPAPPRNRRAVAEPPEASLPVHVDRDELVKAVGVEAAVRLERRLRDAARAFDRERFDEALPKLRTLAR